MRISTDIILSWVRNKCFVTKPLFIAAVIALLVISSCNKDSGEHGTGGISFTLKMPQTESQATQFKAAQFPCEENGIVSVEANVYSSQEILVATGGPWPCTEGEGTITAVEEGEGYTVHVSLRDDNSNVLFRGSKGGINVQAGMTTDAGEITLTAENNPPVFESVANQQVGEGQPLSFTINATDPDEDSLTYSSISLPTGATFDPYTRQFYWIPTLSQGGTHTASFQVTDDGVPSLSDTLDVTITVGNVNQNQPPVLAPIGIQHFTMLSPGTITVSATDPDGDTLTYDIAGMGDPYGWGYLRGMSIDPDTHIFSWDPGSNDYMPGEYKVLFKVIDNGTPMMCDYEWVTIQAYGSSTELDGRMYPVLASIGSQQISSGQTLDFTISATDADPNATLVYSANAISGKTYPSGSVFDTELHRFTWQIGSSANGNYWVRFIVNDNHDMANQQQVFEDVVITVGNVNRPPVLDPIGARDVVMGQTLQFVVTAADPENNTLTFSANASPDYNWPSGATFNPATQTFSWNVPPYDGTIPHSSLHTVRFTVMDNGSPQESAYEDVQILVE